MGAADGRFRTPGHPGHAVCELLPNFGQIWLLTSAALAKHWIGDAGIRKALVHDPCEWLDASAQMDQAAG